MTTTAPAIKERPILFSGPMVRAILDGRKTQTRRVIKGPYSDWEKFDFTGDFESDSGRCFQFDAGRVFCHMLCPYGQPGDRLWVREVAWYRPGDDRVCFTDGDIMAKGWGYVGYKSSQPYVDGELKAFGWKKRPSIHMPRWASRITLEVVNVRVQRLQDISNEDAIAEGVRPVTKDEKVWKYCVYDRGDMSSVPWADMPRDPVSAFQAYLKTHGHMDWDANPWVWVVDFKTLTTGQEAHPTARPTCNHGEHDK